MKKLMWWRHMYQVAGINPWALKLGKVLTIGGLTMAAIGYALTVDMIGIFPNDDPDSYEDLLDFIAAVM